MKDELATMWTGKCREKKAVKIRCLRVPIWTWVLSNTKQKCYPYGRHITHRVGCLISYIIRWREYIRAILTATEEIKSRHTTMHSYKVYFRFFSPTMHEPPSGPGPPHYGGFTNTLKLDTPFFWTSDQPDAETSTWQHQTLTRDKHSRPRRDSNPQS